MCPNYSFPNAAHSRKGEQRSGLPESLTERISALVGLRYHAMLPPANMSNLPSPARALIRDSRNSFVSLDQGHVRGKNDSTLDARAQHFATWLETAGFTINNIILVKQEDFPPILAAYVKAVAAGNNCKSLTNLGDGSIRGYLTAASDAIMMLTLKPCTYIDPTTLGTKRPKIMPMISESLRQRVAWKTPCPRKEPFTMAMIDALRQWLHNHSRSHGIQVTFLTSEYAVYDWTRLGCFTGSRISEYGQSSSGTTAKSRYARIPDTADAGIWAKQSIAFISADFIFYSKDYILVDNSFCHVTNALERIWFLHVRFRFDKSSTNFSIRKYCRLPNAAFDPVIAAINIVRRAHALQLPSNEPLGQYRHPSRSDNSMLKDTHVRDHLRMACCLAYPNPGHYCRVHITGIVSHSNRVFAALCLKLGGASDEDIAFRLRWHVNSVPTYLRECYKGIDDVMQTAICGAYCTA
jgi:hypothetical protein